MERNESELPWRKMAATNNAEEIVCVDVTLRDGGYVNNWNFTRDFIIRHIQVCADVGIEVCEVGFLNNCLPSSSATPFLRNLQVEDISWIRQNVENCPRLAAMVDFGRYSASAIPSASTLGVDIIRIAFDMRDIEPVMLDVEALILKGYALSLNVTRSSLLRDEDLDVLQNLLQRLQMQDTAPAILCFADSFGALYPHDIHRIFARFRSSSIALGFHAHNNLQLAFANALQAVSCGVSFIDCSVRGLGRGAGNLHLENLLQYLGSKGRMYDITLMLDYVDVFSHDLSDLEWGYSPSMMIAGELNVHPYWVDNLQNTRFGSLASLRRVLSAIPSSEKRQYSSMEGRHLQTFLLQSWIELSPMHRFPLHLRNREISSTHCVVVGRGQYANISVPPWGSLFVLLANESNAPALCFHRRCEVMRVFSSATRAQKWLRNSRANMPESIVAPYSAILNDYKNLVYDLPVFHSQQVVKLDPEEYSVVGLPACSTGILCCGVANWLGFQKVYTAGLFGYHPSSPIGSALLDRDRDVCSELRKICSVEILNEGE